MTADGAASSVMATGRPGRLTDVPAPRLAYSITVFCLASAALLAVINVLSVHIDPGRMLILLSCVVVVFTLQLLHCSPSSRTWSTRRKLWTLSTQAVFTYLPMAVFSIGWGGMAGCLAASVLLSVGGRAGWWLFTGISISMVVFPPLLGASAVQTVYVVVSTMLIGLVLYGLSRLTDLVYEVHSAREELARLAVAEERLRFARDLHDLLGYSLSAIALKGELSQRLAQVQPTRAQAEIASLTEIARKALADVRMVASAYRTMSLAAELVSTRSILSAAAIDVQVREAHEDLPDHVDSTLAVSLREGVTNVLRHSDARRCSISVATDQGRAVLTLVNDGVSDNPDTDSALHSGSGIGNLRSRAQAVGGRADADRLAGGQFRLTVEVPLTLPSNPPGDQRPVSNRPVRPVVPAGRPAAAGPVGARTDCGDGAE